MTAAQAFERTYLEWFLYPIGSLGALTAVVFFGAELLVIPARRRLRRLYRNRGA